MPYSGEYATGESLWRLEENPSVKAFKGVIRVRNHGATKVCLRPSTRRGARTRSDGSSPWTAQR